MKRAGEFRIEIPGAILGGRTTEEYVTDERIWEVRYADADHERWVGRGESHTEAYLDLIRDRLGLKL